MFRDRARIVVRADESYLVPTTKGALIVRGEDTLVTMGVQPGQYKEILAIEVRNRGRRDARAHTVTKARRWRGSIHFSDLDSQVPCALPAESATTLTLGHDGGYAHGQESTRRFYVVDGAGRVHPLRERYRQRLQMLVYGWAIRLYFRRQRSRLTKR